MIPRQERNFIIRFLQPFASRIEQATGGKRDCHWLAKTCFDIQAVLASYFFLFHVRGIEEGVERFECMCFIALLISGVSFQFSVDDAKRSLLSRVACGMDNPELKRNRLPFLIFFAITMLASLTGRQIDARIPPFAAAQSVLFGFCYLGLAFQACRPQSLVSES